MNRRLFHTSLVLALVFVEMLSFAGSKVKVILDQSKVIVQTKVAFYKIDQEKNGVAQLQNKDKVSSDDHFFISINNDKECYVYILNIDSSNKLFKVFPSGDITSLTNPIQAMKKNFLPPDSKTEKLMYGFDTTEGREVFYVFLSVKPQPYLESLLKKIPDEGIKINEDKDPLINELEELYIQENANIVQNSSMPEISWFSNKTAKKLVLIHGPSKDSPSYKGEPLVSKNIIVLIDKHHYLKTDGDGSLVLDYPHRGVDAELIYNLNGQMLKANLPLLGIPTKYTLYLKKKNGKYELYHELIPSYKW